MMKLLLAVIATCALVVSPTCIKIKHQLRSNAPTIHVLISNGNTQMTSQVARDGSHRFTTDNLSNMTLAPAGSQTIQLSYDQIFPITDAAVCTEVHPVSAGGCADGVCCKISISLYTITDAIIMTARVNNRKADGNPQFWKCEQEIPVSGVTNTEASLEELVTDILANEADIDGGCSSDAECGDNTHCYIPSTSTTGKGTCKCNNGYKKDDDDAANCIDIDECTTTVQADKHTCKLNGDSGATCNNLVPFFECTCSSTTGWSLEDDNKRCKDINECEDDTDNNCHADATCRNTLGSYTCTCNSGYTGDGTTCTDINECTTTVTADKHDCPSNSECTDGTSPAASYTCACKDGYYGDYENDDTGPELTCTDINECTTTVVADKHNCHDDATCTNEQGYHTCACKDDYYGNGLSCNAKKDNDVVCDKGDGPSKGDNQCKSDNCAKITYAEPERWECKTST